MLMDSTIKEESLDSVEAPDLFREFDDEQFNS